MAEHGVDYRQAAEELELMGRDAMASAFSGDQIEERLARVYGPDLLRADRRAYLSTPITTGPSFIEWWDREGRSYDRGSPQFTERRLRSVVEPNAARAERVAKRVERALRLPTINPAKLEDVEGWQQHNYHAFWAEVVRRYVDTIVFAKGWEFSTGCVIEYGVARANNRVLLTEDFEPLLDRIAIDLLEPANAHLQKRGLEHRAHTHLLHQLAAVQTEYRSTC